LSDADLRGYIAGDLPPAEMLSTSDHLSACASCRQLADEMVAAGAESLRALQSFGSHLADDELQRAARDELEPGTAAALRAHLRSCAVCADQVKDLVEWTRESAPPRESTRSQWFYYAAAAVVLLALLVPATRWLSTSPPDRPIGGSLAGLESLPPGDRDRVRAALANGVAEPPAFLSDLSGRREALMGDPPATTFQPRAPIATAVLTDRPMFEWTALAGADSYRVSIFDEGLREVSGSPELRGTTWQSVEPLVRGHSYSWQVTARMGDRLIVTPTPPAPQARFRILEGDVATRLEQVARDYPTSDVLLGILFAQAGVRTEAERHLRRVAASDQYSDVARKSLERLSSF
jgi:hypothetical protein